MTEFDDRAFRNAMGNFTTGVVIASGMDGEHPVGFAAQSFVSLSLDPPLVALCPGKTSSSWPKIRASGSFCINILGAPQKGICDAMARSGGDKFSDIDWHGGTTGAPIIANCLAYIDCAIEAEHDAGDHTIAIGRVVDFAIHDIGDEEIALEPLLFYKGRYGSFNPLA